jgi:nucleoside-diphosphate-sugar epimerase
MTAGPTQSAGGIPLDQFLAKDFERIGAAPVERCRPLSGQRLYLTGATGFFGRNLLALFAYLQGRGVEFSVTALSRSPQRFLDKQPWCRALRWLEWRQGDVSAGWPGDGKYDLLLHAATETRAEAHVDKLEVFEKIVAGTRQAVAFAAQHGVRRMLLTGSGAQYGAIAADSRRGVSESDAIACDPSRAGSAYGEGKRVSELLAALHAQRDGYAVVNTRCFAFVGPGLALDGHFAIGNFLRDALQRRDIALASSGAATRSYLYGADLALWLVILLLEADGGDALNVGSDRSVTILELAMRVRDLVGQGLQVRPGPPRSGEERHVYFPCIDRARGLGLDVWTNLDEAIVRTAQWHREGRAA